jgi:hypothetical protein
MIHHPVTPAKRREHPDACGVVFVLWCQITYSTIDGDVVMTQASSAELGRYGLKVGRSGGTRDR